MINRYIKLKCLKTLLIDDDPFIRNSMALAFGQKGYPLRVVNSAEEGLAALAQEAFDIMICDYILPGMNGLDFFRQAVSGNPQGIKILISAGGNHDEIATAYSAGIDDYLPKPFAIDALWATLIMHTERRLAGQKRVISWPYLDQTLIEEEHIRSSASYRPYENVAISDRNVTYR